MVKNEKYKGQLISFKKKYKYVSKDYPASPYYIGYIDGKEFARDFRKKDLLSSAKFRINQGMR